MKNHNFNSRYMILTLTLATLLAFFALQAGAVTTITTPHTGSINTNKDSVNILVSSDGNNVLSPDTYESAINTTSVRMVSIDKMDGGADSLVINSTGSATGIETSKGGIVSSDVAVVINNGYRGVDNTGGHVYLNGGVSFDVTAQGIFTDASNTTAVTYVNPTEKYHTISSGSSSGTSAAAGIGAQNSGEVLIGRGSGSLNISNPKNGIYVYNKGLVSSDADLAINATGDTYAVGVENKGGTVNLSGVSIDATWVGINAPTANAVTKINPAPGFNTINATGTGIYASNSGKVLIGAGSSSLNINSGSYGIDVGSNGTVSSDANLVIKNSTDHGILNSGGTVNLSGVSIDAPNTLDSNYSYDPNGYSGVSTYSAAAEYVETPL